MPGGLALQHGEVEVLAAQRLDLRVQALHGQRARRGDHGAAAGVDLLGLRIQT